MTSIGDRLNAMLSPEVLLGQPELLAREFTALAGDVALTLDEGAARLDDERKDHTKRVTLAKARREWHERLLTNVKKADSEPLAVRTTDDTTVVRGRVLDAGGNGLAGARVRLAFEGSEGARIDGFTDLWGRYALRVDKLDDERAARVKVRVDDEIVGTAEAKIGGRGPAVVDLDLETSAKTSGSLRKAIDAARKDEVGAHKARLEEAAAAEKELVADGDTARLHGKLLRKLATDTTAAVRPRKEGDPGDGGKGGKGGKAKASAKPRGGSPARQKPSTKKRRSTSYGRADCHKVRKRG